MTVLQRRLGRRLRQLRDAARKTEHDVEESGLVSRTKLRRIEAGQTATKAGDVRDLCLLFGADTATTDTLVRWAENGKRPNWWEDFDEPMSIRAGLFAGLESIAQHVYVYELGQVPELLQTAAYTRGLYLAVKPGATEADVRDYLKYRQERQAALTERTPPMRLTAVINENALAYCVGDADTMHDQLQVLPQLADHLHIDIRYLPWSVGAHPAMGAGAFTILDFPEPDDPDVACFESHTGARYFELPAELTVYRRVFTNIYALSAPISEYQVGRGARPDPPIDGEL